jgi:hypothetical protein
MNETNVHNATGKNTVVNTGRVQIISLSVANVCKIIHPTITTIPEISCTIFFFILIDLKSYK